MKPTVGMLWLISLKQTCIFVCVVVFLCVCVFVFVFMFVCVCVSTHALDHFV